MSSPNRKTEALERIRMTHQELVDQFTKIAPERMAQPGVNGEWAAKDIMAHVAWWEQHLLRRLRTGHDDLYTAGVDPREVTISANAEIFAASRQQGLDDIRAEFEASYHEPLAELEAMAPEAADQDQIYRAIGADSFMHYPEHTEILRTWAASAHDDHP
jgi:Mycothiol maleylpyruvate isomerase N-terminal domain